MPDREVLAGIVYRLLTGCHAAFSLSSVGTSAIGPVSSPAALSAIRYIAVALGEVVARDGFVFADGAPADGV